MIIKEYLLTIAIPTFNRSDLLQSTLNSVLKQISYEHSIELLVIDNASTDDTMDMMLSYNTTVRYERNKENQGIDYNINECVLRAKGKYVHILSDDDILMEGALENLINFLHQYNGIDFVYLNGVVFSDKFIESESDQLHKIFDIKHDEIFTDKNKYLESLWIWATFVSSFVVKRDKWVANSSLKSYIGTDILLSYALVDLLSTAKTMAIIATPSIAIRTAYSGNYRIIYAFAYQWKKLLLEHCVKLGFEPRVMQKIYHKSVVKDLFPRVLAISKKKKLDINSQEYRLLVESLQDLSIGKYLILPLLHLPVKLLRKVSKIYKLFNINNLDNKIYH
ncbi:glycosyltransferase family 2 protein [Sulfuricurvum sp.]|uniref:glycosyltransferase family 2 protein n=1 Tax=Sulfuricurvum sp. TaxID=2025608 RepID=UPI00261ED8C3|nr:glycosyltransferase family 2 protein [Sulfuricurvum sp.]MDD3596886.1 glycosyltransferase family 2 protein [Sulfuricurvum sp.]